MTTPMKRVLALHGYSQNAVILSKRIGALRNSKECRNIEFVFVNAPHILLPSELHSSLDLNTMSAELDSTQANPETAMRGWWKANKERTKMTGLEDALLVMRDTLKNQTFDGIFGFSQGAALAGLVAALLERPHLHPPFLVDGKAPHPPLQFCVSVSGFRVNDPLVSDIYLPNYSTPTLHVIGRTDVVVVEERSKQLVDVSAVKRVEEHDGGHFVPSKGNWRKFFAAYMNDPLAAHPSPSVVPGSGPSDTATQGRLDYRNAVTVKL